MSPSPSAVSLAALVLFAPAALGADLSILNTNAPGQGLNDRTPASPVGLNFGVTRGQQAIIALQYAASIWGATLNSSVPIVIDSAFVTSQEDPRFVCSSTSGILGITGVASFVSTAQLPVQGASYPVALANALLGEDLTPGEPHIVSRFNASVGTTACLQNQSFFYGLVGRGAAGQDDLVSVFLHEFAHGLGFLSAVDPFTGSFGKLAPSVFDLHVWDVAQATTWQSETDTDRQTAAASTNGLSLEGTALAQAVTDFLTFQPTFSVDVPGVQNPVPFAPAGFSGAFPVGGVPVVAAVPLDACNDVTNAPLLAGKLALIERTIPDGGAPCRFVDKAIRAQDAGAAGVIFFNYQPGAPLVSPSGSPALSIPVGFVSLETGTAILGQTAVAQVIGTFGQTALRGGVDASGDRVLLYTPSTVVSASSVSHFGTSATPPLLMEPTLQPSVLNQLDLTPALLSDLGWSVVQGLSLVVMKALDPQIYPNQNPSYLLTLVNRRTVAANDVTLDFTLPAGSTVLSTAGACAQGFPCSLGEVAPGAVLLSVVTVHVPSPAANPFVVAATASVSNPDSADLLHATSSLPAVNSTGCSSTEAPPALLGLLLSLLFVATRRRRRQ
jgi:MYXO-CTERM domain-containing protein